MDGRHTEIESTDGPSCVDEPSAVAAEIAATHAKAPTVIIR